MQVRYHLQFLFSTKLVPVANVLHSRFLILEKERAEHYIHVLKSWKRVSNPFPSSFTCIGWSQKADNHVSKSCFRNVFKMTRWLSGKLLVLSYVHFYFSNLVFKKSKFSQKRFSPQETLHITFHPMIGLSMSSFGLITLTTLALSKTRWGAEIYTRLYFSCNDTISRIKINYISPKQ